MYSRLILSAFALAAAVGVLAFAFTSGSPTTATAGSSTGTAVGTGTVASTGTAAVTTHTPGTTQTVVTTATVVRTPTPQGGQGCTPGFWKNHPNAWPPTGYSTGQSIGSVFTTPYPGVSNATLLEGLSFGGGPTVEAKTKILMRAAIAAVLNASHPSISYPQDAATIIAQVNAAIATGNASTIIALATTLDNQNNAGCPINGR